MRVKKRNLESEPTDRDAQRKKTRGDEADTSIQAVTPIHQTNDITYLQKLLDFTKPDNLSDISDQFNKVANALLHDFHLVVKCGDTETQFQILELEFYLLKSGCHEDPFTHGTEEQKFGGRWCVL